MDELMKNSPETEAAIKAAAAHYEELLRQQVARQTRMEAGSRAKDYASMDKIVIGVIGGDGIGPKITEQASRVLEKLLSDEIACGRVELRKIEGLTIENRLACGKPIPDDVLAEIKACDVILKGPTTTPNGGTMESANVAMRKALDLYANVRPVCIPAEGIDWTFFRENTEGEYALGSSGIEIPGKLTMDFKVTTLCGTRRIARAAFEYAKNNGKTSVSIVTKANIMKKTDGMFSSICHEVAKDYPGIEVDEYYIDIMTANLVKAGTRSKFQVFVLPNLYGDIVTDVAAEHQGGLGTASSSNIGNRYALFEAIHGTAPRLIARGCGDYADPCSLIRAMGMMMAHIGYADRKQLLEKALDICTITERKLVVTRRKEDASAEEFTTYLLETIDRLRNEQ
jgi:isocitrate dehydrogenase (NAD+)